MNETLKDKGLKSALKGRQEFRLSSNFTFRTMQKVDEAIRLQEKKEERRMLFATIAASLLLVAGGITGLIICFGETMKRMYIPPVFFLLVLSVPLFLLFDQWMRKQYFRRHSS